MNNNINVNNVQVGTESQKRSLSFFSRWAHKKTEANCLPLFPAPRTFKKSWSLANAVPRTGDPGSSPRNRPWTLYMLLCVEVVDETTKELFVFVSINFIPLVCMVSGIISVMFVPPHRHVLQGNDDFTEGAVLHKSDKVLCSSHSHHAATLSARASSKNRARVTLPPSKAFTHKPAKVSPSACLFARKVMI
jgi:hypothetical protein